jgi:hypothetical protein
MVEKIGKRRIKQVEGNSVDDIIFKDIDTDEELTFDEYIKLITEQ